MYILFSIVVVLWNSLCYTWIFNNDFDCPEIAWKLKFSELVVTNMQNNPNPSKSTLKPLIPAQNELQGGNFLVATVYLFTFFFASIINLQIWNTATWLFAPRCFCVQTARDNEWQMWFAGHSHQLSTLDSNSKNLFNVVAWSGCSLSWAGAHQCLPFQILFYIKAGMV